MDIQKEKRNRLIRLFAFVMLLGATQTWAIMAGGGAQAEAEVVTTIKGWLWVSAFMPFAVGTGLVVLTKNYLEQKDEQSNGQTEPKFQRYAKLIGAFVGGVIIMFIVYGLWGMVFMGESSFTATWNKLVTPFWEQIFQ